MAAAGRGTPLRHLDKQEAAFFALRGRKPRIKVNRGTRGAPFTWTWDEGLERLRQEYRADTLL
jgi:hypothetical protein